MAWEELASGLSEGDYDAICSSISITEDREKEFDFSRPYYTAKQVQVIEKGFTGFRSGTADDLIGKRVGALVGSTGFELGQKASGIELKPYDNIQTAMNDLLAKKLEGVICDEPVANYYINFKFVGLLQQAQFIRDKKTEQYGIAVKKGNAYTLDLINTGISGVQARGIDRELQLKWLVR